MSGDRQVGIGLVIAHTAYACRVKPLVVRGVCTKSTSIAPKSIHQVSYRLSPFLWAVTMAQTHRKSTIPRTARVAIICAVSEAPLMLSYVRRRLVPSEMQESLSLLTPAMTC